MTSSRGALALVLASLCACAEDVEPRREVELSDEAAWPRASLLPPATGPRLLDVVGGHEPIG